MIIIKRILFLVMLPILTVYCGTRITSYSETGNQIRIKVELESFTAKTLYAYIDESKPGEISIPARNIILGIPYGENPLINYNVEKQISYSLFPSFNPEPFISDSNIIYKKPEKIFYNAPEKIIKVKGYMWVENIYCLSIDINQFIYDDKYRVMNEIKEIEIIITFNRNIIIKSRPIKDRKNNSIILNYPESVKYSEDKPHYDYVDTTGNWIDYNKSYLKIKTASDGIYRIYYSDLQETGINLSSIDPMTINIYNNGYKTPIYIAGEEDHAFNENDYIEFLGGRNYGGRHREISGYNEPYKEYLNRYSDTIVYWLTWGDFEKLRVGMAVNNKCEDTLTYYTEVLHYEQDNWFDYSTDNLIRRETPYWIENKTWGWHAISTGIQSYNFNTTSVRGGKELKLYAKLQSYASSIFEKSHLVGLGINEDPIVYDSGYINKFEQKVLTAQLSSDLLNNGLNRLKIISYPTASAINTLFFDWYEVEYPREIKLNYDSLAFSIRYLDKPSLKNIRITNINNIKYSGWVKGAEYKKLNLTTDETGVFVITDSISSDSKYFIVAEDKISKPSIESPKNFINLRSSRQKDYLLITHKKFLQGADEYKKFIETSYKLKAEVIDVCDIYDEYAYGYFNPEAIQHFLKSVYKNWETELPRFVFLVGDGTYDYHRNKERNLGSPAVENYVPSFGSPVSDTWFVIWDTTETYIPVMNIGRLPIKSVEEFYYYLDKHRKYFNRKPDDWNKRYLFFSGGLGNDESEQEYLRGINNRIINNYVLPPPLGGKSVHFYKTKDPVSNYGPFTPIEIKNAFDSSGLFISYLGHSGTQTWDNGIVDPFQLVNHKDRFPLITDFGCSTGKFAEPDVTSFAEMFINSGEAIAYIGNSSLGFFSTSSEYPEIFYKNILQNAVYCLSEAHKLAKAELLNRFGSSGSYSLFALTSTFFGDPVINLPIPDKTDLVIKESGIKMNVQNPDDKTDSIFFSVNYFNLGKVTADSVTLIFEDYYKDSVFFKKTIILPLTLYSELTEIKVPVKNLPGKHQLRINLDPDNQLEELSEINNSTGYEYFVNNSDLRLLNNYQYEGAVKDTLELLNPFSINGSNEIILELSRNADFNNKLILVSEPGKYITVFNIKQAAGEGRWWLRGRTANNETFSFTRSIYAGSEYDYLVNDSIGLINLELKNLKVAGSRIMPDTITNIFSVISAGFNDGKTAVVSKNEQNFVPGGNTIGHHVCIFKDSTYEFVDYKRFNVYAGATETWEYYNFLDTLSSDYLLLVAVNDEGRVPDSLKKLLHEFGSLYIDSLRFRSSWALIGKRGAPAGSVPEGYSHPFEGKVEIDTAITSTYEMGTFTTPLIGPANKWDHIKSSQHISAITGIKESGEYVTLNNILNDKNYVDLTGIDPEEFPYLRIIGEITNITDSAFIGVKYDGLPELILNCSQSLLNKDTITQGEDLHIDFTVSNAGESSAYNFDILIINKNNNTQDTVFFKSIKSIIPKEIINFSIPYAAFFTGNNNLHINIDNGNSVNELFEDNNDMIIPFYAEQDTLMPSLEITFDGVEVFDGDFVSHSPEVIIKINGNLFNTDTTGFILVDGLPVSYQSFEGGYKLNPDLDYGVHTFTFTLKKSSRKMEWAKKVIVDEDCRLLSVYNYPNPFNNGTYFTFSLTRIPEELTINIYTIAGRLIRKIKKYSSELRMDFNSIYWDGKDEDAERVGNGVYLYKILLKDKGKTSSFIQKLVVVR